MLHATSALLISVLFSVPGLAPNQAQTRNPSALFKQAQVALAKGDYANAERGFHEVLEIDPQSAAAYTNLGVIYLRTNKIDFAIKAFENAKKLSPQVVGIDLNLGLAYYTKKDFRRAISYFGRVLYR